MKLELSDGQRALDLLSGGSIYAVQEGFDLPLPGRDVTYIEPVDGDGRRRIRTKDTNGEGRIQAMISGTSDANFWDNVDNLLELVQSAHRNQGSITYTPPGGTDEITWDLEAITVTGLPQKGQQLATRRGECEIAFETRPYGKLAGTTINLDNSNPQKILSGPIDYATVGGIAGQIEAFAELKLTDISGQNRRQIEIGVQDVFDPSDPEPLLLTAGSMTAAGGTLQLLSGALGTAVPDGTYTQSGTASLAIESVVTSSPIAMLSTGPQKHKGLWKVRARVNASDPDLRVRLAWRTGEGQFTREQWREISKTNTWLDVDLGTIDIPKLGSTNLWEARLEGIGGVGFPSLYIDYVTLIPADKYLRLRGVEVIENAGPIVSGDDFQSHAAGTLNGKTPPLTQGGNWVTAGGSVDFVIESRETNVVTRAGTNDSTAIAGRFAQFGTVDFNDVEISTQLFPYPSVGGTYIDYPGASSGTLGDATGGQAGIVLRYQDTQNHVKVFYTRNAYQRQVSVVRRQAPRYLNPGIPLRDLIAARKGTVEGLDLVWVDVVGQRIETEFNYLSLHLQKVVGGTATDLGRIDYGPVGGNSRTFIGGGERNLKILAGTAGDIEIWEGPRGEDPIRQIAYPGDAQLATGGTLETGRIGLFHSNTRGTADLSEYYSITAQDPSFEGNLQPAIRADNAVEITESSAITLAGTLGEGGPTPIREGQYLQLEPTTRNGNQSRIVVRARRNDNHLGQEDLGIADQVEARIEITPRVTLR